LVYRIVTIFFSGTITAVSPVTKFNIRKALLGGFEPPFPLHTPSGITGS
jgi:hypothetical protein